MAEEGAVPDAEAALLLQELRLEVRERLAPLRRREHARPPGPHLRGQGDKVNVFSTFYEVLQTFIKFTFLTRNSVAVAHVVAQCTNRCTRRKVIVNAQPPRRKPKMKKICCYENRKTTRRTSARGTSSTLA